jgi:hypothetical protein
MTCRVNSIYLTFGSFNDMDLIIPFFKKNVFFVNFGRGGAWRHLGEDGT